MKITNRSVFAMLVAILVLAIGCKQSANEAGNGGAAADPHGGHVHPTEGPHQGDLIELGVEQYHAELIHDSESVTIYVLDDTATEAVPISEPSVTINLTHEGTPEQFVLTASPDEGDPEGQSSKFVIKSTELASLIDDEHVEAKLVIKIEDISFSGKISHSHEGHADH